MCVHTTWSADHATAPGFLVTPIDLRCWGGRYGMAALHHDGQSCDAWEIRHTTLWPTTYAAHHHNIQTVSRLESVPIYGDHIPLGCHFTTRDRWLNIWCISWHACCHHTLWSWASPCGQCTACWSHCGSHQMLKHHPKTTGVIAAMAMLGVPRPYLQALDSMFHQMARIIEITGLVGEPQLSTTGVPEGCCFSIVCMMALTTWVARSLELAGDSTSVVAYADNWEIIAGSVDDLQQALGVLLKIIDELRVKIAPEKSWLWATHTDERKQLRDLDCGGLCVPVKLVSVDLGCDVSYCHRKTHTTAKKRMLKVGRVMHKLARKHVPKRVKATMAKQLSQSIVGFGSELVYYTKTNFKTMRSLGCRALGRIRGGANPFLALYAVGDIKDPEPALLVRKCMFWRRFFMHFPHQRAPLLSRLTQATAKMRTGPAAVLRDTFQDHGWSCKPGGVIEHYLGWKVNWTQCSKRFLRAVLDKSWNVRICGHPMCRNRFELQCVDALVVHKVMKQLADETYPHFCNYVIGKHVTNDALVRYSKGAPSPNCPLCGDPDSRMHRLHNCPRVADIRAEYDDVFQWLTAQPHATQSFGLVEENLQALNKRLRKVVDIRPTSTIHPTVSDQTVVSIYTDGSAIHPHDFAVAYAAGAYVVRDHNTVGKCVSAMVPGPDHSPFRAEIWGVILALRDHVYVHLHVDCQSAVVICRYLVKCREEALEPKFKDHHDLWLCVWQLLLTRPKGAVVVSKVKAHQDIALISDLEERQRAKFNSLADSHAKKCVDRHLRGQKRALQMHVDAQAHNAEMLKKFADLWCAINKVFIQKIIQTSPDRDGQVPNFACACNPVLAVCHPCLATDLDLHASGWTNVRWKGL